MDLLDIAGQSLGNAREPSCGGFTATGLQHLNLATMDFSEFYDSIHPVAVRSEETAARATPDACYYGEGQCGESPQ